MIRVIIVSDLRGEGSSTICNQIYSALKKDKFNVTIEAESKWHSELLMKNKIKIKPDKREITIYDCIKGNDTQK